MSMLLTRSLSTDGGLRGLAAATFSPAALRACLLLGCAGSVLAALALAAALGGPPAYLRADPELAFLLRGMAAIKTLGVAAAVGVLGWRFGHAIGRGHALIYLAGAWGTAGTTTLIWQLTAIGPAALAFHVGAFALLLVAFADRKVTSPKSPARP